jgi:hypothetical protein
MRRYGIPKEAFRRADGPLLYASVVLALGLLLIGCGKKEEEDPLDYMKALIPKIEAALNSRDIPALKKLGTPTFEANRFITDVFSRGVRGDVSLALARFRDVPGQVRLEMHAKFGVDGKGGQKRLTIYFSDVKKPFKMDTYSLRDVMIPPPEKKPGTSDTIPPEETTTQSPS